MPDTTSSSRITANLLTSRRTTGLGYCLSLSLALAIVLGPTQGTIAQDKSSPSTKLKTAIAKAKELEARLAKLKADATNAAKAAATAETALKAQQAATSKLAALQEENIRDHYVGSLGREPSFQLS